MAFYTGKEVAVWITHECGESAANTYQLAVIQSSTGENQMGILGTGTTRSPEMLAGPIYSAGHANLGVTDLTGGDISIGAVDEDISYFQTAIIGKIEVKKETSVTLTRKMSDKAFLIAYQGKVAAASAEDTAGNHSCRWGLKEDNKISSGQVDPKSHIDADSNISYGFRVYVKLKDSGQVLAIPNCTLMSHGLTIGNDSATEETVEFMSTVKPLLANDGSFNKVPTAAGSI